MHSHAAVDLLAEPVEPVGDPGGRFDEHHGGRGGLPARALRPRRSGLPA